MSGYEVEHNLPVHPSNNEASSRRPDLSTFFSTLELVDTSGAQDGEGRRNAHATPQLGDMAAAHRLLANAFQIMRVEGSDSNELLDNLIDYLTTNADDPPKELAGVPDTFLADLERVPKTKLKQSDVCPICGLLFLDDKYPLVVRLPCHKDHLFDLECVAPWLKLNPTCPLDRKVLWKKPEPPQPVSDEDDEFDEMYA